MTSGPAASDSRQGRAAKLLGAYLHSPGKPEWRAWCPVHEAERITHGLPCERGGRNGSPSLAILPDGDNGYPRYECVSQDCHTTNTKAFLAAVQRLVGAELVWSPEPRLTLVTGDEGDAESNPLPAPEDLDCWQTNLLGKTRLAEDAARFLGYLRDEVGMTPAQVQAEGLGLCNFGFSRQSALLSAGLRVVVPVWDEGGALATVRLWNPLHPKKSQRIRNWTGYGAAGLLGAHKITGWPADEPILFCEGEGDYLAATAAGFRAVTGTGGAGTPPALLSALRGRDVVIAYDNDPAGSAGADKLAAALDDYRARPYLAHIGEVLPARGSDVRDLLHVEDGADTLRQLVEQAVGAGPWTPEAAAVRRAADAERVRRAARRQVAEEEALAGWEAPPGLLTLAEELALERQERQVTIEGLHFTGFNTVIISGFKTGKTVLALNLIKALADGEKFLGHYPVAQPAGRVAWWNCELTEDNAVDWLRDLNISNPDRVSAWHLRGYTLPLRTEIAAMAAVEWLRERDVKVLVIDPFGALYDGEENSNDDMRDWGKALDRIKRLAGLDDVFLVMHTGRAVAEEGEEHGRGATRMDDWVDIRWTYTKDKALPGRRFLRAFGRGVDEPSFPVAFDPETRRLWRDGASITQREAAIESGARKVLRAVAGFVPGDDDLGPKSSQIRDALGAGRNTDKDSHLAYAKQQCWVRVEDGPRNAKHHYLTLAGEEELSRAGGR